MEDPKRLLGWEMMGSEGAPNPKTIKDISSEKTSSVDWEQASSHPAYLRHALMDRLYTILSMHRSRVILASLRHQQSAESVEFFIVYFLKQPVY